MSDTQDPNPPEPVGGTPLFDRTTLLVLVKELRNDILAEQEVLFSRHRALNPVPAGLDLNTLSDAQLMAIWEDGYTDANGNPEGTGRFEERRLGAEIDFLSRYVHGTPPAGELAQETLMLRQRVATLEQNMDALVAEKEALQGQLDALRADLPRVPDDFATAVSHSLDAIQTRMALLSNPVSDFAVREFSIEAKVAIDVSPLGTVGYRFIRPGDVVTESQVSKLAMTVVPIPKQTTAGIWTGADFTPALGVEEIPGLSADNLQRLHDQQIFTISDLLHAGSRVKSTLELAGLLDVPRETLEQWISFAQLMTVREITAEHAQVLYSIDIRSLRTLAEADAATVVTNFNWELDASGQPSPAPISLEQAEGWIRVAQAFVGVTPAPAPAAPEA